ncbi:hypothetical protein Emed_004169 [Eimeria media]
MVRRLLNVASSCAVITCMFLTSVKTQDSQSRQGAATPSFQNDSSGFQNAAFPPSQSAYSDTGRDSDPPKDTVGSQSESDPPPQADDTGVGPDAAPSNDVNPPGGDAAAQQSQGFPSQPGAGLMRMESSAAGAGSNPLGVADATSASAGAAGVAAESALQKLTEFRPRHRKTVDGRLCAAAFVHEGQTYTDCTDARSPDGTTDALRAFAKKEFGALMATNEEMHTCGAAHAALKETLGQTESRLSRGTKCLERLQAALKEVGLIESAIEDVRTTIEREGAKSLQDPENCLVKPGQASTGKTHPRRNSSAEKNTEFESSWVFDSAFLRDGVQPFVDDKSHYLVDIPLRYHGRRMLRSLSQPNIDSFAVELNVPAILYVASYADEPLPLEPTKDASWTVHDSHESMTLLSGVDASGRALEAKRLSIKFISLRSAGGTHFKVAHTAIPFIIFVEPRKDEAFSCDAEEEVVSLVGGPVLAECEASSEKPGGFDCNSGLNGKHMDRRFGTWKTKGAGVGQSITVRFRHLVQLSPSHTAVKAEISQMYVNGMESGEAIPEVVPLEEGFQFIAVCPHHCVVSPEGRVYGVSPFAPGSTGWLVDDGSMRRMRNGIEYVVAHNGIYQVEALLALPFESQYGNAPIYLQINGVSIAHGAVVPKGRVFGGAATVEVTEKLIDVASICKDAACGVEPTMLLSLSISYVGPLPGHNYEKEEE